ncbi:cytochrome d ubiquinol oxidase subunit II [Roseovarius sp. M141]|uniref:cytochrome d ubiquinol oxidase subunit II n=1 Tax=Roseovarius sp. M141 TaxID=2583806 RepID=UPI0020CCBA22|nr:cytochrome d ubiquinol oxidase subunit II [Roseovarius sp. M141]MCQ0090654.1 cytochrome d ubiquinol oxidase subunit II [Roseovarius sp. M141]
MVDLSFVWAGIIAFAILAYVILDGFDLGVGILFPAIRPGSGMRSRMMNSIAPVWDGNETWLVMGSGGLFAVFPLAYGIALTALYVPIFAMLFGLVFRGVAFEFRWRVEERNKFYWDWAFIGGSYTAAFFQGVALGALVQGIKVSDRAYAGGWWDWLTPFSLTCGLAVVIGYALLGATWLVMKTDGWLQRRMREYAWRAAFGTIFLIMVVSLWTPFHNPEYLTRWFSWPSVLYSAIVPFCMFVLTILLFAGLETQKDVQPFLCGLGIFFLCFVGIGISFYPQIIPPDIEIREAAAPDKSLAFLLVGAAFMLPVILTYTAFSYWVFRMRWPHPIDLRSSGLL